MKTKRKRTAPARLQATQGARIIQLVTAHWDNNQGKRNSSLYGLMDDGRVVQYVPSADPEAAGWKRLKMRPPTPVIPPTGDWEADL